MSATLLGHAPAVRALAPDLVVGLVRVDHVTVDIDLARLDAVLARDLAAALAMVADAPESALVPVRAWRRVFAAMGLRPTQYRCAAEQLLRRVRRDGDLPRLHPLVDVCNAASAAAAVPVAALDLDRVAVPVVVRPADGSETYRTFGGDDEHPEPGEVVFADAAGHAHARRWTHRQSGLSAVSAGTRHALVVCEAVHPGAEPDVRALVDALTTSFAALGWSVGPAEVRTAG